MPIDSERSPHRIDADAISGYQVDNFDLPDLALGETVEVRRRFDRAWAQGFEIAATDENGYRLRRTSDGAILPVAFPAADVRPQQSPYSR